MFTETKFGQPINLALIETVTTGFDERGNEDNPEGTNWAVLAVMVSGKYITLDRFKTKEQAERNKKAVLSGLIIAAMPHVVPASKLFT